jgi:hypothetical protein
MAVNSLTWDALSSDVVKQQIIAAAGLKGDDADALVRAYFNSCCLIMFCTGRNSRAEIDSR